MKCYCPSVNYLGVLFSLWCQIGFGQLSPVRGLAAGMAHTCLLDDWGVKCWGRNDDGQSNAPKPFSLWNTQMGLGLILKSLILEER